MSSPLLHLKPLLRMLWTLLMVAIALVLVTALWRTYVLAPWTRDGRVSAQVVRIAPEVSGTIAEVRVADNQLVRRGDVLYRIDPQRFQLAVRQAEAQLAAATESLLQKTEEARRRKGLDELVPREDIQRSNSAVAIAQAEQRRAQVALDIARLDLARTTLYAPVDGYVTRLRLRQGDYALAGQPAVHLLEAHSFWVTGYFEETKLSGIRLGAPAQVRLMGYAELIQGQVTSIGRGIADSNDQPDEHGLPNVEPTFSWVRLAQRIPVRIDLDEIPANIVLVAGMTGSVEIGEPGQNDAPRGRLTTWLHRLM